MKNQPKVSILVPCYNVEKYIRKCMDSVVNQTLKEIEVICINDGSNDNTLAILKEYAQKDNRIVIVDKSNSGYGDSMNQGLKKATGEYIGIVESDDFVEPDMFEKLYQLAINYQTDIVKSNYFEYITKNNSHQKIYNIATTIQNQKVSPLDQPDSFKSAPAIWSAIYRKDFLDKHDITFLPTPGASYQDTAFNFKALFCADSVYFTDEAYLYYRQDNINSSINNPKKVFCICDEYHEIERFVQKYPTKYETIKYFLPILKWGAYLWNYNRLTYPMNYQFLKVFANEFKVYQKQGLLIKGMWRKRSWRQLMRLIRCPLFFFVYSYLRRKK